MLAHRPDLTALVQLSIWSGVFPTCIGFFGGLGPDRLGLFFLLLLLLLLLLTATGPTHIAPPPFRLLHSLLLMSSTCVQLASSKVYLPPAVQESPGHHRHDHHRRRGGGRRGSLWILWSPYNKVTGFTVGGSFMSEISCHKKVILNP